MCSKKIFIRSEKLIIKVGKHKNLILGRILEPLSLDFFHKG